MPGLVDPHTHAIWAGDRAAEFEMRLEGKTYLEILAAGGGILSTVQATRKASLERLLNETRRRLWSMFSYGTTTAEIKTGYGLRTAAELRMLQALINLNGEGPLELAFTFLGAHAIAPEYRDQPDEYTRLICETMLPMLKDWWPSHAPYLDMPFVDVFCETGAFTLEQSRCILQTARGLGFALKIHADEFGNLGRRSWRSSLALFLPTTWSLLLPVRSKHWGTAARLQWPYRRLRSAWQKDNTPPPASSWKLEGSSPSPRTSTPAQPGARACSLPLHWPAAIYA